MLNCSEGFNYLKTSKYGMMWLSAGEHFPYSNCCLVLLVTCAIDFNQFELYGWFVLVFLGDTFPTLLHDSLEEKRNDYMETNTSENYAEIQTLKGRTETLESQLAALEEQCRREKNKKEELSEQIVNLHLKLSASEEKSSGLSEELQQCWADYQKIVSELDKQKTINKEQEEKIIQLNNEIEGAKKSIIDKVSKIKTMQSKVDELHTRHVESSPVDIDLDLVNLMDSLDAEKDEPERIQVSPVCMQSQTAATVDLRWENSFHCSIESIWEEGKNIIKSSSQKNQRIQELLQQVEDLKKERGDTESYNNQLKIKFEEQIQRKTYDFEKQAAKDQKKIAQLEEEVACYKEKISDLECFLEAFRSREESIMKLEAVLKEKESIILNLESNAVALQEQCANSDNKLKELSDQEENLKEQLLQLMNRLENMEHSLQEKEKKEDEQIQIIKS